MQYSPKRSRFGLGRYRSKVYRLEGHFLPRVIVEVKHQIFPQPLKILQYLYSLKNLLFLNRYFNLVAVTTLGMIILVMRIFRFIRLKKSVNLKFRVF